jgi:hypothetical protein
LPSARCRLIRFSIRARRVSIARVSAAGQDRRCPRLFGGRRLSLDLPGKRRFGIEPVFDFLIGGEGCLSRIEQCRTRLLALLVGFGEQSAAVTAGSEAGVIRSDALRASSAG